MTPLRTLPTKRLAIYLYIGTMDAQSKDQMLSVWIHQTVGMSLAGDIWINGFEEIWRTDDPLDRIALVYINMPILWLN
jgi:hypothetical protein